MSGRYAEYCLDLEGMRFIREYMSENWPEELFKPMYKDRTCTDQFVQKCLLIFGMYQKLNEQYGSTVSIFTASELRKREDCPRPLPSLYVDSTEYENTDWFMEILTDPLFFYIKKRVQQYVAHYQEYGWEGSTYPTVILIVLNEKLRKKAERYIRRYLEDNFLDVDEVSITATLVENITL